MIVSALLTSVGINFALCVLFFTLYSVLRKQPSNYEVYNPRLLADGSSKRSSQFNLDRLIPSPGWVKRAWQLTEEDILVLAGLDGLVFMRLITFSLKVFVVAGVLGSFVLLPVNLTGDQLREIDFADLSNSSLDLFTISNVKSGSKRLWAHFCAVYILTAFVCWLLYYEYNYLSLQRNAWFNASKPHPNQFTILVRNIPVSPGSTVSESVGSFFKKNYPSTYLSHVVVHRTNRVRSLIINANQLYEKLLHLQKDPDSQIHKRSGMFGNKVDLVDQYEKKLEDIEENVRLEQSEASLVAEASFFIAYVVTSGWTSTSSELFRIIRLIFSLFTRCFKKSTDEEVQVPPIMYHKQIPRILFFGLLGITYFFLAPLILPFLLVYLCLAYIVYRNQFVNVYAPKYDSTGKFWPIVHNSMIFSLVLMQCIAIGILALKKVSIASTLVFPLPVLTLLFNQYCRKRFLPNFIGYSAEVLIKKDKQDENDPNMEEFFNKLVTAYQDPALEPLRLSANGNSLTTPLISSRSREIENHDHER